MIREDLAGGPAVDEGLQVRWEGCRGQGAAPMPVDIEDGFVLKKGAKRPSSSQQAEAS